jgi:serine/threonine-protein kinase RsbW
MGEQEEMVRMLNERTIEVSLPNKLGYERIAMDCSASFASIFGFASERIDDLKTAVAEACCNAIEHGNKDRPDTKVLVTMKFNDDFMSVFVEDEGDGISELPKDADVLRKIEKLEPPRGLGMYLIKRLVDQVEFNEVTKVGHGVRMVIKLSN